VAATKIEDVERLTRVTDDLCGVELCRDEFFSLVRDQELLVFGKFVRVLQLALGFDDPWYDEETRFEFRGKCANGILVNRLLARVITPGIGDSQRVVEHMRTAGICFFNLRDEI
jgi:hypothetical protein